VYLRGRREEIPDAVGRQLDDLGVSPAEIACRLGTPTGEMELILGPQEKR